MPLLLVSRKLMSWQFDSSAALHRWSSAYKRFFHVHSREQITCAHSPQWSLLLAPFFARSCALAKIPGSSTPCWPGYTAPCPPRPVWLIQGALCPCICVTYLTRCSQVLRNPASCIHYKLLRAQLSISITISLAFRPLSDSHWCVQV